MNKSTLKRILDENIALSRENILLKDEVEYLQHKIWFMENKQSRIRKTINELLKGELQ